MSPRLSVMCLLGFLCMPVLAERPVEETESEGFATVELSTVGLDLRTGAPVVILRDAGSDRVVPIWVGPAEAQAIAIALHGVQVPRPLTHDLMANVLRELDATVEEVLVHSLRGGTYFGSIHLRLGGNGKLHEIDSRPSDAMALALRTGSRIRVAEAILQDAPDFDFIVPEGLEPVVRVLGITVVRADEEQRREAGLPEGKRGLFVRSVAGEAREKGLRPGDFILEVGGVAMEEPMDFLQGIRRALQVGPLVPVTYWREGETHEIHLRPAAPAPAPAPDRPEPRLRPV